MSSSSSSIKTESRPIWERPPPPPIVLPELPPEDPSRQMTLIEYLMLASAPEIAGQTWTSVRQTCENQQLLELTILHCFTEVPPLGKRRINQYAHDHYPNVAIKVWKRIGILYSQQVMSGCLMAAKTKLHGRMRWLIMPNTLSKEKVEEKLREWPLYLYMRTYFDEEYEKQLRTAAFKEKYGQLFAFESKDQDDGEKEKNIRSVESMPADNIGSSTPSGSKRPALVESKQEEGEPPEKNPQPSTSGSSLQMTALSRQHQEARYEPWPQGMARSFSDTSGSSRQYKEAHCTPSHRDIKKVSPSQFGSKPPALLEFKQEEVEPPAKLPQVEPSTSGSSRDLTSRQHQAHFEPSAQGVSNPSHQQRVARHDPSLQELLSYSPDILGSSRQHHHEPSYRNMPGPSYQHQMASGFLQQRESLGLQQNMSMPTVLSETELYHFNEDMKYLNRKLLRIHEKDETLYRAALSAVLQVTSAIERKAPNNSLESIFLGLAKIFKKVPE